MTWWSISVSKWLETMIVSPPPFQPFFLLRNRGLLTTKWGDPPSMDSGKWNQDLQINACTCIYIYIYIFSYYIYTCKYIHIHITYNIYMNLNRY